jgi:hypothetical protein
MPQAKGHGPRVVKNVHHGSHVRNVRSRSGHLGSPGVSFFFIVSKERVARNYSNVKEENTRLFSYNFRLLDL